MTLDFQAPSSAAAVDWALAYAAAGMAVFPVGANGIPALSRAEGGRGFKDATTDPDQIKIWWKRWPHAEIAWAVPAGVVVVDLDVKKGKRGPKDFFDREKVEPATVDTPIAVTPSGGLHLVFDDRGNPYRNDVAIDGTGIDLRSAGLGYIVLPRAGNGRWWIKPLSTPLAPAPKWLPTKPPQRPPGEARPFTGESVTRCSRCSPARLSRHREGPLRRAGSHAQRPVLSHRPAYRRGATRRGSGGCGS
jgi:hypothetical protein